MKNTDGGRKVYSGGGIEPDKFIVGPVEGFNPTRFGRTLYARQAFANFADQFTAEGDTRMGAANKNKKRIAKGFQVTAAMVDDFKASLKSQRIVLDEESFAKDDAFIRAMIHYDIDLALFGVEEATAQPRRRGSAGPVRARAVSGRGPDDGDGAQSHGGRTTDSGRALAPYFGVIL